MANTILTFTDGTQWELTGTIGEDTGYSYTDTYGQHSWDTTHYPNAIVGIHIGSNVVKLGSSSFPTQLTALTLDKDLVLTVSDSSTFNPYQSLGITEFTIPVGVSFAQNIGSRGYFGSQTTSITFLGRSKADVDAMVLPEGKSPTEFWGVDPETVFHYENADEGGDTEATILQDLPLSTDIVTQVELDNALVALSGDYATKAEVEEAIAEKTDKTDVIDIINKQAKAAAGGGSTGGNPLAGNYAYRSGSSSGTFIDVDGATTAVNMFEKPSIWTVVRSDKPTNKIDRIFDALINEETSIPENVTVITKDNSFDYESFDDVVQHDYVDTGDTSGLQTIADNLASSTQTGVIASPTLDEWGGGWSIGIESDSYAGGGKFVFGWTSGSYPGDRTDDFSTEEEKAWYQSSGVAAMKEMIRQYVPQMSADYHSSGLHGFYAFPFTDDSIGGNMDLYLFFEPVTSGYMESGIKYNGYPEDYDEYQYSGYPEVFPTANETYNIPLSAITPQSGMATWQSGIGEAVLVQEEFDNYVKSKVISDFGGGEAGSEANELSVFATKSAVETLGTKVSALEEMQSSIQGFEALPTDGSIGAIEIVNKVNALIAALKG